MALQRYHRDPDDDSNPPDDAAYVLDAYRGQHNIDPTRMKMAIDQQANMIEWAQQNVVDPLVLARGFQVLEVASNYTDESIRNAALTIIHQANESTNDMVISMAFGTSTQNLYNELVALSSFVEYSTCGGSRTGTRTKNYFAFLFLLRFSHFSGEVEPETFLLGSKKRSRNKIKGILSLIKVEEYRPKNVFLFLLLKPTFWSK